MWVNSGIWMNKNIVLLGLGAVAIVLVGGLFLFSPQKERISFTQSFSSQISKNKENIDIIYQNKNLKISDSKSSKHRIIQSDPKYRKIDSSIKAVTIDQYGRYMIALVDKNPNSISSKGQKKYSLNGKVNGSYFVLDIPESSIYKENVKLRIIDRKTKKVQEIDAPFLTELPSIGAKDQYFINIDTHDLSKTQTEVKFHNPEVDTALPPLY